MDQRRTLCDVLADLQVTESSREYFQEKLAAVEKRQADLEAEAAEVMRQAGVWSVRHGDGVARRLGTSIAWEPAPEPPKWSHMIPVEAEPAGVVVITGAAVTCGDLPESDESDA